MKDRLFLKISLWAGLSASTVWGAATVLENFNDLVDGSTYFAGDWTTTSALTGSTTPQSTFVQGDGTYTIVDSGATNGSASFLEVHFASPQDLGTANSIYVTAQALTGNAATSFEVRLFNANGVSAFATFEASSFAGDALATAAVTLVSEPNFDPSAVEIMRVSGARLAGTDAFGFTFDEIALIPPASTQFHSADTNQDGNLNLSELLRLIELYNTRFGSTRTGRYKVDAGQVDGFTPESTIDTDTVVTLTRYHSADSNQDAKLSLSELLRVIELYNYREGTTRTGAYKADPTTTDGFTTGPRD